MQNTPSERRLAENEVVFRQLNQQLHKGSRSDDEALNFFCECSDEKCGEHIYMTLSNYGEIHKNNKRFIVIPGHELLDFEKVISDHSDYKIVQKLVEPPKTADRLNPTSLNNVK